MNKLTAGQDILLIGYPGTLGTLRLLEERPEEIRQRFSGSYLTEEIRRLLSLPILRLEGVMSSAEEIELSPESVASAEERPCIAADGLLLRAEDGTPAPLWEKDVQAKRNAGELVTGFVPDVLPGFRQKYEVSAIRPVGRGGVLAALWNLLAEDGVDEKTGKRHSPGPGCSYRLDRIPLLQITVELCELFGLNPYRLAAEHCFLAVAGSGFQLCEDLRSRGLEAAVFGRIEKDKKRVRTDGREPAFLTGEQEDALERLGIALT